MRHWTAIFVALIVASASSAEADLASDGTAPEPVMSYAAPQGGIPITIDWRSGVFYVADGPGAGADLEYCVSDNRDCIVFPAVIDRDISFSASFGSRRVGPVQFHDLGVSSGYFCGQYEDVRVVEALHAGIRTQFYVDAHNEIIGFETGRHRYTRCWFELLMTRSP